ncbi:MAG: tRNA (guanosine(37)-N1)-methyltransferase TrmD, partial [Planctomycetes bacterium]|nr:tRNA (guanosine(37)-N1)-methyltransferase TrmD [Planctomycetota bacterium]
MRIDILSIFPEMFAPVLNESMLRIAQEKQAAEFYAHNIRDWSDNKHCKVDDRPFGGGPGMV